MLECPSSALPEHPRLSVVPVEPSVRDAHDQGRRPPDGDVVDLVLLPRHDAADVEDRGLDDLAHRRLDHATRRRPPLMQCGEVFASVEPGWWPEVIS